MSILSITGAIKQISPPPNVKNGKLESNTDIFLFQERENIRLSSPVSVDISSPGDHANKSLTPGTISAGTHVDSYFLHFDRVGSSSNGKRADGSVTFDEEILGVIVKKKNHKETQSILGNPDTSYERTNDSLGLNNNKDRLTWWGNTLTVSLRTTSSLDQVRVITEHSFPTLTSFLLNGRSSNITISEGDSVSASLFARDPNRDTISFILDGSSIGTDLKVSGTRSSNNLRVFRDNGTFTYRAQARDEDGKSSSTITRTVTVNNVAPTITSLTQDFSIRIDKTFSFAATATDPGLADILIYEWDFDGDGEYDDFTGSSGEWSFSEPGDHEVKLRVSDGDGGFDYDSFTVTAEANLVEPYSFRFTDIKAVSDDPEGNEFQFSFEIINWSDRPAAGIQIAIHEDTNQVQIDEPPEFAGATVDSNRDPITGNLNLPNNSTVSESDNTSIQWNLGDPLLNRDVLGPATNERACQLVPGCDLLSGEPRISNINDIDNGDNVRDGFVFNVDNWDEGEILILNWFLKDENRNNIGTADAGNQNGYGLVQFYRQGLIENNNPDASFGVPGFIDRGELFHDDVYRVTEFG